MPTRQARTPQQYEQEAEQLVERITRDLEDASILDDEDAWMEHVQRYIFGGADVGLTDGQMDFFNFVREFAQETFALTSYRIEIIPTAGGERSIFRDTLTGRFVSRESAMQALRVRVFGLS